MVFDKVISHMKASGKTDREIEVEITKQIECEMQKLRKKVIYRAKIGVEESID